MNKERYNQIIDEAYKNYCTQLAKDSFLSLKDRLPLDIFINKIKTDSEFSERWGLIIKETYKLIPHTEVYPDFIVTRPVRKYKLIVVYKNEIIEVYE